MSYSHPSMTHSQLLGLLIVAGAGLSVGLSPWPLKRLRKFQYEHWAFVAMLAGLIALPWIVTLATCPDAFGAYRSVGWRILAKATIFSVCWGIANILYLLCFVRIGVSLTSGIVTGVTVVFGVIGPMIFKGTGVFQDAPAIGSPAGLVVIAGMGVMLAGVVLASLAGLGRERAPSTSRSADSGFLRGLVMAVIAGVLGSGLSFAFVYSQGPILQAMKARGASDFHANVAVWAAGLFGGALANVVYPAYLMTKRRSWQILRQFPRELLLAAIFGTVFVAGFTLLGKGMLLLGALGASIGFGVQQNVQMLGNQVVGFAHGEWRGAGPKCLTQMGWAIALLVLALIILAWSNSLASR